MEKFFRDDIEVGAVDKFFCSEMRRQIHRYIKAMHGSRSSLEKFEENLHNLDIPQRERALAQYIDLNRQVVDMLDWRQLVARSIANYCDSYDYFKEMVTDLDTIDFYVQRMKEKYLRFHKVFEEMVNSVSAIMMAMSYFPLLTISFAHLMYMSMICVRCL